MVYKPRRLRHGVARPGGSLGDRPELLAEPFCYLTTTGRRSGLPRTVEIWFAGEDDTVYMVSGYGRASNWVRNLVREPRVAVTIGGVQFPGLARVLDPSRDGEAWRRGAGLCCRKYYGRDASYLAQGWSRSAAVVEIRIVGPGRPPEVRARDGPGE